MLRFYDIRLQLGRCQLTILAFAASGMIQVIDTIVVRLAQAGTWLT